MFRCLRATRELCLLLSFLWLLIPAIGLAQSNECFFPEDCDDGDVCTRDDCTGGVCHNVPQLDCCRSDLYCNDNYECTEDICDLETGTCSNNLIDGCQIFDCSGNDTLCDDGDICTADSCSSGACMNTQIPGCCGADSDCDDGNNCTSDSCNTSTGSCTHSTIATCCSSDSDCNDGNACTTDSCSAGSCQNDSIPGCCSSDLECNDSDMCTDDVCVGSPGFCYFSPRPGCCQQDYECDDGNTCTADTCDANSCNNSTISGCCLIDTDCSDGNVCTADICSANSCTHPQISGCCLSASDCNDNDDCTADSCDSNSCTNTAIPGCGGGICGDGNVDAGEECDDGNTTDGDGCSSGCTSEGMLDECQTGEDCGLPGDCLDPATIVLEFGNHCNIYTPECIYSLSEGRNICSEGAPFLCYFTTAEDAVCDGSGNSCDDGSTVCCDGDPCTNDQCDLTTGNCAFMPIQGCTDTGGGCCEDSDCNDSDACTEDMCVSGLCSNTPIEGCNIGSDECTVDADCDDNDPCTDHRCIGFPKHCEYPLEPGNCPTPCSTDADCDDGNPNDCWQGRCNASGFCGHPQWRSGQACDDGDPCRSNDTCGPMPESGCVGEDDEGVGGRCHHPSPCITDRCVPNDTDVGTCENIDIDSCYVCRTDSDCNDGIDVTIDKCFCCGGSPLFPWQGRCENNLPAFMAHSLTGIIGGTTLLSADPAGVDFNSEQIGEMALELAEQFNSASGALKGFLSDLTPRSQEARMVKKLKKMADRSERVAGRFIRSLTKIGSNKKKQRRAVVRLNRKLNRTAARAGKIENQLTDIVIG